MKLFSQIMKLSSFIFKENYVFIEEKVTPLTKLLDN